MNNTSTDTRIKKMVRSQSPKVLEDQWFVKKTVNRLPPKNNRLISLPEVGAFLLVFTVCVVIIVLQLRTLLSQEINAENSTLLCSALAVLICSTAYMGGTVLRRCLN